MMWACRPRSLRSLLLICICSADLACRASNADDRQPKLLELGPKPGPVAPLSTPTRMLAAHSLKKAVIAFGSEATTPFAWSCRPDRQRTLRSARNANLTCASSKVSMTTRLQVRVRIASWRADGCDNFVAPARNFPMCENTGAYRSPDVLGIELERFVEGADRGRRCARVSSR